MMIKVRPDPNEKNSLMKAQIINMRNVELNRKSVKKRSKLIIKVLR